MGKQLILYGLLVLSLYAAIIIQIMIHEAGHLVFGLATGYRFCSFRIFSWMWVEEEGKLRFRRLSISGTGGQCLMAPPELQDGKMPVLLYNFGGSIMNLAVSAVFLGLSFLLPSTSFIALFLLVLALVGLAFAIMNGVPLHLGAVDNDGCNALSLMRSEEAARAFWVQLKANEQISRGRRLKDMPAEWFAMPGDEAMQNSMIATVGVLACNRLMDEHRFAEAEDQMAHLLSMESGIVGMYRSLLTCDRVFVELISQNRREILDSLLTKEQVKFMKAMKTFPSVLRTEYAMALLADRDEGKAQKIEKMFDRCASRYPYPSEITGEKEYMQIARERAAG